jgi:putative phage-type endonuclease
MTAIELWEQKIGLRDPTEQNEAMKLGHKHEEKIRQWASEWSNENDYNFTPDVVVHPKIDFIMASLDGVDFENEVVLEAKVCNEEIFKQIRSGLCPDHFYPQIQMQLACTGFYHCWLVAYNPKSDEFYRLMVYQDDDAIEYYIKAAQTFKDCVDNLTSPHMTDRDYYQEDNEELALLCSQYKEIQGIIKVFEEQEAKIKKEIIELSSSRNTRCGSFKITKVNRKGSIDYAKLFYDLCINDTEIEKFRKCDTEYFTISEEK